MHDVLTTEPAPPFRMLHADGTLHYSALKNIALSGKAYLQALEPHEPTGPMLLGTAAAQLLFGPRPNKPPILFYEGKTRKGKAWDEFKDANEGREILTAGEAARARAIAEAVRLDPVAAPLLDGARFETAIRWEENGIPCSTDGIDIISGNRLGDFKTTRTAHPPTFERLAFNMLYHCQIAFYLRGCRAVGIDVSGPPFILAAQTKGAIEIVVLRLSPSLLELADKTVALWLERFQCFYESREFPGYAQSEIEWLPPAYLQAAEESEEDDEGEEIAAQ